MPRRPTTVLPLLRSLGSHSPHQRMPIGSKSSRQFDMGWNAPAAELIFANQKRVGRFPTMPRLTDWPDSLPKWETFHPIRRSCSPAAEVPGYTRLTPITEIARVISSRRHGPILDKPPLDHLQAMVHGNQPRGYAVRYAPKSYTLYNGILDFPIEEELKFY